MATRNKTFLEQTNRVEERVEERWAKTEEKLEKKVNEAFDKLCEKLEEQKAELKVFREEQKDLRSKVSMVLVVVGPGDFVKALLAMLLKNFNF